MSEGSSALFHYVGVQRAAAGEGGVVRNVISAQSGLDAETLLEAAGIEIWEIHEEIQIGRVLRSVPWPAPLVRALGWAFPWMQAKVPPVDLHLFFQNLASYIRITKTIDALARMGESLANPTLKAVSQALAAHMQTMRLSAALALYPNVFGATVPKMIAGGEESDLAAVCDRVSSWYLVQHESSLDLWATVINPGFLAAGGLVLAIGLKVGYVPTLEQMYQTYTGGGVPWFTQSTINALDVIVNVQSFSGWLVGLAIAAIVMRVTVMRSRRARAVWEWVVMNLGGPMGHLYRASNTEDAAWTLSLAHASDLGWAVALDTASSQSRSVRIGDALSKMSLRFREESVPWWRCFQDDRVMDPVLRDYLQGAEGAMSPAESCQAAGSLLHTHVAVHRRVVKETLPNAVSAAVVIPIGWMVLTLLAPAFLILPHILENVFAHSATPITP